MKNFWKEMYGTSTKEFCDGVIAGIKAFAVWDNGEELVGARRRPLKEVIKEVKEGLGKEDYSHHDMAEQTASSSGVTECVRGSTPRAAVSGHDDTDTDTGNLR